MQLNQQLAFGHYVLGEWRNAAEDLRQLIAEFARTSEPDQILTATSERFLGQVLIQLGDFKEAGDVLRRSIDRLIQRVGEKHLQVAQSRTFLGETLTEQGRYADADVVLSAAVDGATQWAPNQSAPYVLRARLPQGRLRLAEGRLGDAAEILESVLGEFLAAKGPERDQTQVVRRPLAEVYLRQGRLDAAAQQLRHALTTTEKTEGPGHPVTERIRIALADVLREQGAKADAWGQLKAVGSRVFENLPDRHPILAQMRRVEGLLWLAEGQHDRARVALTEALEIYEYRYGTGHWRTQTARGALSQVPVSAVSGAP
jgi:tetratricopeptide (TPR) repeat protein